MSSGRGYSAAVAVPVAASTPAAASTAAPALPPDTSSAAVLSSPGPAHVHVHSHL